MKVYFRIFISSIIFVSFILLFLTFGKQFLGLFSFLKPGIDHFFSIVGGDNPYIKFVTFFLFWFIVVFGFSYLAFLVMNTYVWSTNLGHERKSSLDRILSASREEIVTLILAVDYIMIVSFILIGVFQKNLVNLWQLGSLAFNRHLLIFWLSLFIAFFFFLVILHLFMNKLEEIEEMKEHI